MNELSIILKFLQKKGTDVPANTFHLTALRYAEKTHINAGAKVENIC